MCAWALEKKPISTERNLVGEIIQAFLRSRLSLSRTPIIISSDHLHETEDFLTQCMQPSAPPSASPPLPLRCRAPFPQPPPLPHPRPSTTPLDWVHRRALGQRFPLPPAPQPAAAAGPARWGWRSPHHPAVPQKSTSPPAGATQRRLVCVCARARACVRACVCVCVSDSEGPDGGPLGVPAALSGSAGRCLPLFELSLLPR